MSLASAREALLDDARRHAEEIVAQAEADARERLEAARRDADELIARAHAEGEAEGREQAARAQAGERFAAHMQVLAARRASYDALRERARYAALGLREDPSYSHLLARLEAAARRDLGADAELTLDPSRGGVIARAGSREVDYTLAALAERCVEELGAKVAALWA
jgi:vacuolar-type H+-ATPase subunit E/Vma4